MYSFSVGAVTFRTNEDFEDEFKIILMYIVRKLAITLPHNSINLSLAAHQHDFFQKLSLLQQHNYSHMDFTMVLFIQTPTHTHTHS